MDERRTARHQATPAGAGTGGTTIDGTHGPPHRPLLSVQDLRVRFHTDQGVLEAAHGLWYDVRPGEVLGIVGESGSGKTVSAMAVLRLLPRHAEVTGRIVFDGRNLFDLPAAGMRLVRGRRIAMVFQDALAALNPLHRVGAQVAEAITTHRRNVGRRELRERTVQLLADVGIPDAAAAARRYPHEFSGGMRQRAMIAMAMANDPELIIADEPTTALDVTTQAQVLEVLERMRERTGSAMILISHNLGIVTGVADRILVMYAGSLVEIGDVGDVIDHPTHPYTAGLLRSVPRLEAQGGRLERIHGQPPSLLRLPAGCAFHPRCPDARLPSPCGCEVPSLRDVTGREHRCACHLAADMPAVETGRAATAFGGAPSPPSGRTSERAPA